MRTCRGKAAWRGLLSWRAALCSVIVSAGAAQGATVDGNETRLNDLQVLQDAYPRAFFFRQSEAMAARNSLSYERWEETFERLMGIEGKVLDEEIVGRSIRNVEFFTRYKRRHPHQLVLLHFNGNARDPRWQSARFFAGHWVYYNGATILSDVPPDGRETEIKVEDARLFKVNMGRYRDRNEDIGLCLLDGDGTPDWSESEQVQLVAVDRSKKTIRVRRGCYGTKPRAFPAGRSYAAAHVTEGPWGKSNHLLWFYNYATCCPRDSEGQTCCDVLVEHLAELFSPAGSLAAFDGLEFDVLHWQCGGGGPGRGPDCDADGRADRGYSDGRNAYGIGVVQFCRALRERLGEDRLMLADGMGQRNQRAFGILNGIESEGWPHLSDRLIQDWSGGLNRHVFWNENGRRPAFNYINHKYRVPSGRPGQPLRAEVPFSTDRLVFAVAALTSSAVCYSDAPANDREGRLGVWDELHMGAEKRPGWLGKPLGPPVRLAARQRDVLRLGTAPAGDNLAERMVGAGLRFVPDHGALRVEASDASVAELRFRLREVPCDGPDLVVLLTARAAPLRGYPPQVARMMHVGAAATPEAPSRAARFMTWLNANEFASAFYFSTIDGRQVDLEFTVESSEPIWIHRVQAYAYPDVMYREFEHGLVLANPSPRPYSFAPARLFPSLHLRRLQGVRTQDPVVNDGSAVGETVTLGPRDGLFLIKARPR